MNRDVEISEVGPRDGLQMLKGIMPTSAKKAWIAALAAAGLLTPVAGAVCQEVIDVAAVMNAVRAALPSMASMKPDTTMNHAARS